MSKIEKTKVPYKVMNWSEYNRHLECRGSLTLWISDEVLSGWYADLPATKGGQFKFSDNCIESLYSIRLLFGLGYRQTRGFAVSLLGLMGLSLRVPCHTQIWRRSQELEIEIGGPKNGIIRHLVVDSTGLKVYGEGEWKVRKHGHSKRRTWRKLHISVDSDTGFITGVELTGNNADDASQVDALLDQTQPEVDCFSGDGAYDKSKCWDTLDERGIRAVIPPRDDANYWTDNNGDLLIHDRNAILEQIDTIGKSAWKKESNYHKRSLSETAVYRFKSIFSNRMSSRKMETQKIEARMKIKIMNQFTAIGMPVSICWD